MENIELLEGLFDNKIINIISLLLQSREKQFYLREISKDSKVPIATTFRILQKLIKLKIVKTIKVSRFKLYQVEENDQVMFLASIIKAKKKALQDFVDAMKRIKDVNMVILHGEETEVKANLLIIGGDIDITKVKDIVRETKERHDFTISYMTLTPDQYNQMSSIGLLPRQKRILFERR